MTDTSTEAIKALAERLRRVKYTREEWHEPHGLITVSVFPDEAGQDGVEEHPLNPDGPEAAAALLAVMQERNTVLQREADTIKRYDDKLDAAEAKLRGALADLRQVDVQAVHAAISRRSWQAVEVAANKMRDKMDRAALAATPAPAVPKDDEPQSFRELAEAAIMDLRRYAHDETPERRMASVEAYEERFRLLTATPTPAIDPQRDADRALKDALFACLKGNRTTAQYGGVRVSPAGDMAWVRFSIETPAPEGGSAP